MRSGKRHRGVIDLRKGAQKRPEAAGHIAARMPELGLVRFRRSPLRAKRRKKQALVALGILVLLAAIGYGVHLLSYVPQLTINGVVVEGTEAVSPELVRAYVESVIEDGSYRLLARDNIFVYPRAVIERALATDFPRIRTANVSRDSLLAQAVRVKVVERRPFGVWCAAEIADAASGCYVFDETGFVFAEAPLDSRTKDRYTFTGGVAEPASPIGSFVAEAHIHGIIALITMLERTGYQPLGAKIVDGRDFHVPLKDGYLLKVSYGASPSTVVHNLELVLASETLTENRDTIEYIDLRFGNRVYYKLRTDAEEPHEEESIDVL